MTGPHSCRASILIVKASLWLCQPRPFTSCTRCHPPRHRRSWSALSRRDRYLARAAAAAAAGDHDGSAAAGAAAAADDDNPLPNHVDPITLEPVVAPAISPYGHVMGMATWRAVLSESRRCPFTKLGLRPEQLVALTKSNIDRYPRRDRAAVIWAA